MQLTCRRCNGTFHAAGNTAMPCPACGSIDVIAQQPTRSPMAATVERSMSSFSAPVSQPVAPMPAQSPAPLAPYVPHSPSYPAPPPQQYAPYAPAPSHAAFPVQPVQVVIQNHVGVPYPVAPYAMVPYVRRKDAGVATLLSFFLPGAGQLYNGQVGKGLAFLLVTLFVNFPLMFIGVGFLTGLITWIWGMIDAHSTAERINRGEIVV